VVEETGATTSDERNIKGSNGGLKPAQITSKIITNGKR
jgi:hypothetical protein